jgi:hypothetical protein
MAAPYLIVNNSAHNRHLRMRSADCVLVRGAFRGGASGLGPRRNLEHGDYYSLALFYRHRRA